MAQAFGYDGNVPVFEPARDIFAKDPLTGKIRRETPDGPQNVNTDRVSWLFNRGNINARQAAAANRLQRDWERSQISPCSGALGSMGVGAGSRSDFTPSDAKIKAGNDYSAARRALGRWTSIVDLVVIQNVTVTEAGKRLGIHNLVASDRLDAGLEILANHYGLPE